MGVTELREKVANDAPPAPAIRKHQHLPALDGLRGIAVLLVFLLHYGGGSQSANPLLHGMGIGIQAGWVGVTLFFILSGFLITGILWDGRGRPGQLPNFYMRRVLRIFPLYYGSLLLVLVAAACVGNGRFAVTHAYVYGLYLQNVPFPFGAGNLGSRLELSHLWSLAVEEQFYLVWPFLMLCVRTSRGARWLCCSVFAASFAFRIFAWYLLPDAASLAGTEPYRVFHGAYGFVLSRAGELAAGAWLALCFRDKPLWRRLQTIAPVVGIASFVAFLMSAAMAHTPTLECGPMFMLGLPCATVCLATVLVLSLEPGVVKRLMTRSALQWLGGISYGFYIFHVLFMHAFEWLVAVAAPNAGHNVTLGLTFVVAGTLSLLLAWLSFRFLEMPFLRLRSRFRAG